MRIISYTHAYGMIERDRRKIIKRMKSFLSYEMLREHKSYPARRMSRSNVKISNIRYACDIKSVS